MPNKIPMHRVWAQLEELVTLGLAKDIGVSNFNVQLLLDMFTYAEVMPSCNQVELHPYFQQKELVEFC